MTHPSTKERLRRGDALLLLAEAEPTRAHKWEADRAVLWELADLEILLIEDHIRAYVALADAELARIRRESGAASPEVSRPDSGRKDLS